VPTHRRSKHLLPGLRHPLARPRRDSSAPSSSPAQCRSARGERRRKRMLFDRQRLQRVGRRRRGSVRLDRIHVEAPRLRRVRRGNRGWWIAIVCKSRERGRVVVDGPTGRSGRHPTARKRGRRPAARHPRSGARTCIPNAHGHGRLHEYRCAGQKHVSVAHKLGTVSDVLIQGHRLNLPFLQTYRAAAFTMDASLEWRATASTTLAVGLILWLDKLAAPVSIDGGDMGGRIVIASGVDSTLMPYFGLHFGP